MLQIKRRKDGKKKWRFMCTICFYQDSRHEKSLHWIKNILGIGYISKRNDGMTELRINGFKQVRDILKDLIPFIKFKKDQASALFKATDLLSRSSILSNKNLLELIKFILIIQNNNYVTKKKRTKDELMTVLGLTP